MVDLELPDAHSSNWGNEVSGQYGHNYGDKLSLDSQLPVKIETMERFAQARHQQGERPTSGSQSGLLENIAKRGNRTVSKGRNSPYPPVQTTLKLERKFRKNTREKQRRQELNEKFETLCSLLHLGRKTKAEKFTILSEAINSINALRRENAALKREKTKLYRLLQNNPNSGELNGSSPQRRQQSATSFIPKIPPSTALGLSTTSDGLDDGPDDPGGMDDMQDDTLIGNQNIIKNEDFHNGTIEEENEQNDHEIKLNLKLNVDTDDTIDIPLGPLQMPSINQTNNMSNPLNNSNQVNNMNHVNINLNHMNLNTNSTHLKMNTVINNNLMNNGRVHMNGPKGQRQGDGGQGLGSILNSPGNKFLPLNSPLKFEHSLVDSPLPLPFSQHSHPTLLPPFDFDIPSDNFSSKLLSPNSSKLDSPFSISHNF